MCYERPLTPQQIKAGRNHELGRKNRKIEEAAALKGNVTKFNKVIMYRASYGTEEFS